jgi:hypothetical protein
MRIPSKISWLAAALAGIAALIPAITGVIARQQFDGWVDNLRQQPALEVAETGAYQQGWLGGAAELEIRSRGTTFPPLRLRHEARHGLLPLQAPLIDTRLSFADTPEKILLAAHTQVGMLGQHEVELHMPGGQFQAADGSPRSFDNISGTLQAGITRLEGDLSLAAASVDGYELAQGRAQLQWQRKEAGLTGATTLQAREIRFRSGMPGRWQDVKLQLNNTEAAQLLKLDMNASAATVELAGEPLGAFAAEAVAEQISIPALLRFVAALKENSGLPPQESKTPAQIFLRYAADLLQSQPALRLSRLQLQTPHGVLQGNLRFNIAPLTPVMQTLPILMLQAVDAEANATLPRPALLDVLRPQLRYHLQQAGQPPLSAEELEQKAAEILDRVTAPWLEKKYLSFADDTYHCKLQLRQGKLQINGQTVKLKDLLGLL